MKQHLQIKKILATLCLAILSSSNITAQTITTICGTGVQGYSGDNGPALTAQILAYQGQLSVDAVGNIYIGDRDNARIRKITVSTGSITTVVGNGTGGFSGDGGLATAAQINFCEGVAVDNAGNIYICDRGNNRIRKVSTTGTITTICGNGTASSTGDGGLAAAATVNSPGHICVDQSGNIYFTEVSGHRIRKIAPTGTITTYAGTGVGGTNTGNGGLATAATINNPWGITCDASGNVYVASNSAFSNGSQVRKIATTGIITAYAGTGVSGFAGDGGAATSGRITEAGGLGINLSTGDVFISDRNNARIRKVSSTGIINTYAGNGTGGYSGDGGSPTAAQITFNLYGVTAFGCNTYWIDNAYSRIRKVTGGAVPSVSVTSGSICIGNSFTMVASGANTYTFQGGNAVVSPTNNTSYSVIGTATNGCVSQNLAVSNITVNALPTVSATSNSTLICVGQTASLSASGASTYIWSTTSNNTVIAISPTITTSYTVTGTDGNGCVNTSLITQSVSACTSINQLTNSAFELNAYPNPFNNKLTIISNETNQPVLIYNALGSVVYSSTIQTTKTEINLSNQATGIYYIKIGITTKKLIKE